MNDERGKEEKEENDERRMMNDERGKEEKEENDERRTMNGEQEMTNEGGKRMVNTEQEKPGDLKERLKEYSLRIIRMYCSLPKTSVAQVLGGQALRSGTSPGAHHREASRARSTAEFISKLEGGLQELDETAYWLELLVGSGIMPPEKMQGLLDETEELMAIFTASVITVKKRKP